MLAKVVNLAGSAAVALMFAGGVFCQSTGFRGEIVNYDNGAIIVDAKIIVSQKKKVWTTISDETGTYNIKLDPGVYEITIEALGFKPVRRKSIKLEGKGLFTFNVNMKNSGIIVDAKHPVIPSIRPPAANKRPVPLVF